MGTFVRLWRNGPYFAQAEHFRLGTDSVLLADFVRLTGAKRGIDLGCASGILMLLLAARSETLDMTGIEIVPEAASLAMENICMNGLEDRSGVIEGDLRDYKNILPAGFFDFVVSNPPYYKAGSGKVSDNPDRAAARGELCCTLEDVCDAAAYFCKTGGNAYMVNKPERLAEMIYLLSAKGLEPKRLRFVRNTVESIPSLVLVEAKRGGKPGLKLEDDLILKYSDGVETPEYKRIYHR